MWDLLTLVESNVGSRNQVQALDSGVAISFAFLTGRQQHLHPETDPEQRRVACCNLEEFLAERISVLDTFAKRADTGEDNPIGSGERVGVVGDLDIGTSAL